MKLNKSLRAVEHGEGYFQINAVAVAFRVKWEWFTIPSPQYHDVNLCIMLIVPCHDQFYGLPWGYPGIYFSNFEFQISCALRVYINTSGHPNF